MLLDHQKHFLTAGGGSDKQAFSLSIPFPPKRKSLFPLTLILLCLILMESQKKRMYFI